MKLFLHPNALSDERRQAAKRCAALLATRFACMAAPEHAAWLLDGRAPKLSPPEALRKVRELGRKTEGGGADGRS